MNRSIAIVRLGPLLFAILGCATNSATPTPAKTPVAAGSACDDYAKRLCGELGARSDACASSVSVLALMPPSACAAGLTDFATTRTRIAELRKTCERVADHVCEQLGKDSESCRAITQNLPDIPPGHCMALANDEERVIAALREREAASNVSGERWQQLLEGAPPGFGSAEAAVAVVEFTDFQCPYCAQAAQTVHRLKDDYLGKIRFVVRQFPLSFHADARGAARAALAAHDQGKFWEFHDLLFAHQEALDADALLGYAKQAGLAQDKFKAAVSADSTAERVEHDIELGKRVSVQGTPTLFINGKRIADPLDYTSVARAVDSALGQ